MIKKCWPSLEEVWQINMIRFSFGGIIVGINLLKYFKLNDPTSLQVDASQILKSRIVHCHVLYFYHYLMQILINKAKTKTKWILCFIMMHIRFKNICRFQTAAPTQSLLQQSNQLPCRAKFNLFFLLTCCFMHEYSLPVKHIKRRTFTDN